MTTHLAVLYPEFIDRIIEGTKTIEMRLTKTRRAPYGNVMPGELIYFKQSGGPIRATAIADKVKTLTDLTPERIDEIRAAHNDGITSDDAAWAKKRQARFGTLIWLRDIVATNEGPIIPPLYGAAWVCNPHERAIAGAPCPL